MVITPKRISPYDNWLMDDLGNLVGIQNPNANGQDLLPWPYSDAKTTAVSVQLSSININQVMDVTAAATLTIPADALLWKTASDTNRATFIAYQVNAGAVTWAAGSGVTLVGTPPTAAQYLTTGVIRVGANTWAYL